MSNISIRLPDKVDRRLKREQEISGEKRSDLEREAIGDYLVRREKDRFRAGMVRAAKALYADPEARKEAQQIQSDFDAVDDVMASIEADEQAHGRESEGR